MDPYTITLHEIQREKQRANDRITEAMRDFEESTGLKVTDLEYYTITVGGMGDVPESKVMEFKTIIVKI